MRARLLFVSLFVVLSLIVGACSQSAPAAPAPAAPTAAPAAPKAAPAAPTAAPAAAKEAPKPAENPAAQPAAKPQLPQSINVGSGTVGGGFYIGGDLASKAIEAETGGKANNSPTEGSLENVRLLDRKQIDLGTVGSLQAWQAYNGGLDKKYTDVRVIGQLSPNCTLYLTIKGSGIKVFTDLKGKRLGGGTGKATWDPINEAFFVGHGMPYPGDTKMIWGTYDDLYTQMKDGSLDASVGALSGCRVPLPAMNELKAAREVEVIQYTPQAVEKMTKDFPYASKIVAPKGTYGLAEDMTVVNNSAMYLLSRADLSEDAAYQFAKALNARAKWIAEQSPIFKPLGDDPKIAAVDIQVPFHPGAAKYWKEVGYMK